MITYDFFYRCSKVIQNSRISCQFILYFFLSTSKLIKYWDLEEEEKKKRKKEGNFYYRLEMVMEL